MYVQAQEIASYHKDNKNRKLNVGGADERELDEALQRSLKDMGREDEEGAFVGTVLNKGAGGAGEEAKNNFKAFGGKGVSLAN